MVGGRRLVANSVAQDLVRNGSNFLVPVPGCPQPSQEAPFPWWSLRMPPCGAGLHGDPAAHPKPREHHRVSQRSLGTEPHTAKMPQSLAGEEATSLCQL